MALAQHLDRLTRFVDWFIPAEIAANRESREKARIFLYSHIFGPFIGNTVPLSVFLLDTTADYRVAILFASITAFWIFPPLLRFWGHYYILSIASVQNLIFCILWSCYFYGGLSSPMVAWMLTIPLLSFMYVGSAAAMRAILIGQFVINSLIFYYISITYTPPAMTLATPALQALGLISTAAASAYVTLMALSYANALASQVELQSEMEKHLHTAADLLSATEDARRSSTAKSDFIARMSHELRTPLNAIIGYSEILLDDVESESDPTAARDLERIRDAGHYLLKLVNRILDLSRIEAGRMDVTSETVDCNDVVDNLTRDLASLAGKNGNRIVFQRTEDDVSTATDALKLKQILSNLIENAAQYAQNGSIVVTLRRADERIVIAIADDGPGIPPDRLPGLLNNFDSLDDEKENYAAGGAGLGLPLARRLCDLIDGVLSLESTLGQGTTMTLSLPVRTQAAPAAAEPDADWVFAKAEQGVRALATVGAAMRGDDADGAKGAGNAKAAAG